METYDIEDDLKMSRKNMIQERNTPFLESFRHDGARWEKGELVSSLVFGAAKASSAEDSLIRVYDREKRKQRRKAQNYASEEESESR